MKAIQTDVYAQMDRYLDARWPNSKKLGQTLYTVFGGQENTGMAQMRRLQNIVATAVRFYDITDYVKNQMGKEVGPQPNKQRYWTAIPNGYNQMTGTLVIEDLEQLLNTAQDLAKSDPHLCPYTLAIYLAKGWIRQVMAEYLFQRAIQEG